MDPLSLLALATLAGAFLVEGNHRSDVPAFGLPKWVVDELWMLYRSRWDDIEGYPTDYQLVQWDKMLEEGRLPMTVLPPDIDNVDITWLADEVSEGDDVVYFMTDGDVAYMHFLRGRYALGDVLWEAWSEIENPDNDDETLQVLWLTHDVREEIAFTFWQEQTMETSNPIQRLLFCIRPLSDDDVYQRAASAIVYSTENSKPQIAWSDDLEEQLAEFINSNGYEGLETDLLFDRINEVAAERAR